MRLPIFFNQRWANFGFAIVLALANQIFGLGMAGILRSLTVYPQEAVWPSTLPILALNRTLINSDNKQETINGWKITRYVCFLIFAGVFLVYYWFPNQFFTAIRLFNWMTWISRKQEPCYSHRLLWRYGLQPVFQLGSQRLGLKCHAVAFLCVSQPACGYLPDIKLKVFQSVPTIYNACYCWHYHPNHVLQERLLVCVHVHQF
jgi:hypothetical protein